MGLFRPLSQYKFFIPMQYSNINLMYVVCLFYFQTTDIKKWYKVLYRLISFARYFWSNCVGCWTLDYAKIRFDSGIVNQSNYFKKNTIYWGKLMLRWELKCEIFVRVTKAFLSRIKINERQQSQDSWFLHMAVKVFFIKSGKNSTHVVSSYFLLECIVREVLYVHLLLDKDTRIIKNW